MSLIAKELALKVLGALAVGGTVIGGGVVVSGYMKKEDPEIKELREEKGLDCRGNYCTLVENKTLTVKHESNITRELTAIPKDGAGKIRIHKTKDGNNSKFSFSIEGGDITPTWATGSESGSGSSITKLEEFETYEIEGGTGDDKDKHFLVRKTKAGDEIKKLLGLGDCSLPTGNSDSTKTCSLNLEKLKAINFEGKTEGKDPTIADTGSATLTISLVADTDKENDTTSIYHYPFDYRFELSGDKEVKIPVSSGEIVKKANDSVEFKIKVTNPTSPGPRKLTLEKVWDVVRLADKLGFTKCDKGAKTCKFPSTINVYKSGTENVKEATVTSHTDKTITFTEEGATDYNGGVKFTVATAVAITGGTQKTTASSVNSIEVGDYEIKQQTAVANNNEKAWYLSKKA